MPAEFDCVDCGIHVYSYMDRPANDDSVCLTCAVLRRIEDPAEREKLRRILTPEVDRGAG